MSATPPPGYTPPPTDLPQRGDRATFSNRVDAWVTWFSTVILTQLAAMVANAYANALDAYASAASALGAKTAAETARDAAQGYRDAAAASATAASGSATAASGSAAAAAASAASAAALAGAFVGTSASSITIGAGNKTFVTQAGEQYTPGIFMTAVSNANGANWMGGQVVSYSGTSLVLNVTVTGGSGTYADWNLSLAGIPGAKGDQGPPGSLNGGQLTGALDWAKGADVASSATPDIWSGAGNYEVITGTATITGFTAAPQAGANRRILAGAAFTLTAGANMIIKGIGSGLSYTVAAGDEIDVYAETTTKFRLTVSKGDGTAMAALYGAFQNVRLLTGTGTYVAEKTGWHRITLAGSSARAGLAVGSHSRATGSSGAGFCVGMVFLVAGQSYNYVQGAAVATGSVATTGALNGVNGNASSFSGTGIPTLTANGGVAGVASVGSTATLTGPSGGTASGGFLNVQGGKAGDVTGTTTGGVHASGGGAVGIRGVGYGSGNVVCNSGAALTASGGAGVGGASGTATRTSSGAAATGGGGFGGSSASVTNAVSTTGSPNYAGVDQGGSQNSLVQFLQQFMNATAGGSAPDSSGVGNRDGAGTGAATTTTSGVGYAAGVFAGSGAFVYSGDVSTTAALGGDPGLYGGGQGGVAVVVNSAGATTIKGGQPGLVQIEF